MITRFSISQETLNLIVAILEELPCKISRQPLNLLERDTQLMEEDNKKQNFTSVNKK